ncbi:hypothetical protein ABIB66_000109 [Bradyrhizobium sp. F1.13.3]
MHHRESLRPQEFDWASSENLVEATVQAPAPPLRLLLSSIRARQMAIMRDLVLRLPHNLTEDGALRSAPAAGSRASGARNTEQRPLSLLTTEPMPTNGCPPTRRVDRFQAALQRQLPSSAETDPSISVRGVGIGRGRRSGRSLQHNGSRPPRRATSLPCKDPVPKPGPHGRNAVGSSERHHRKQGSGGTDWAGRRSTHGDIKPPGPRRFFP